MYGRVSLARAKMDITCGSGFLCFYYGCGEDCSHVTAVLFKVKACICLKIATRICTDLPCVWNRASSKSVCFVFLHAVLFFIIDFVMQVQPSEAVDIHFFKPNKKDRQKRLWLICT